MPFEIARNDITNMRVDAIVNTANLLPQVGTGTSVAIGYLRYRNSLGDCEADGVMHNTLGAPLGSLWEFKKQGQ